MRILITGGNGAIGKKLVARLKKYNYHLRVLTRKNKAGHSDLSNIEFINGDLRNIADLRKATGGIDAIIHLAGITHTNAIPLYYQINTAGTKNIINSCEKNGVKNFLFISSRTASPAGGHYAHSKFLAEKALKRSTLNWAILQPAEIYGASKTEAISKLINFIKKNKFVPYLKGEKYRLCPIYVDDIIDCIIVIIKNNFYTKKTYVLTGPEDLNYDQLTDKLASILRRKIIKIPFPLFFLKIIAEIFYLLKINWLVKDQVSRLLSKKPNDHSLAKNDLGFKPKSLEEGIKLLNL